MKKIILITVMCLLFIISLISAKVYFACKKEFLLAIEEKDNNNSQKALVHLKKALLWYLPKSPYYQKSVKKILEIARESEEKNPESALGIYRELRGSLYASRSLYTPYKDVIKKCNEKIAEIIAGLPPSNKEDVQKSKLLRKKEALAILEKESSPSILWSSVMGAGFLGWVGFTIYFIIIFFNYSDRSCPIKIRIKKTRYLIISGIIFYSLWIIGLINA
ncbi:MAG: hypothetical protein SV062_00355 [Thermodesulfobacteriota bacterium]|nr:hypothetical protein [Thermodesulfobacteriota bacterium]